MARNERDATMTRPRIERGIRSRVPVIAVLAVCTLLSGCGGHSVKNQAPFVQVTSWQLDGTDLQASLRLRNLNDEPLEVARLTLDAVVQDVPLARYAEARTIQVAANGFESLDLQLTASRAGAALLAELQNGDYPSLPYSLKGSVETADGKTFRFERDGHVYTVPGKPGHFR